MDYELMVLVGIGSSEIGTCAISFMIAKAVFQRGPRSFEFLISFCAGLMFALGSFCLIVESANRAALEWPVSILISSITFLIIMGFEQIVNNTANARLGYEAVSLSSSSQHDEEGIGNLDNSIDGGIRLSNINSAIEISAPNNGIAPSSDEGGALRQFYPYFLLVFVLLHDFVEGLMVDIKYFGLDGFQPSIFETLTELLIRKACIGCAIGVILEMTKVPSVEFLRFAFMYSIAAPVGMVIHVSLTPFSDVNNALFHDINIIYELVCAANAGAFLYISVVYMMPSLWYYQNKSVCFKVLKYTSCVIGYVIIAATCSNAVL